MKHLILAVIFLTGSAVADDVTIPNTFTAGTPARAAEVNANFNAVEASVDDNAANIVLVSQNVSTHAQSISSNAQSISSNSQSISSNSQSTSANAQRISSNDQDIEAIAQSVSSIIAPPAFEFVGFSSAQVDGAAGFFGMKAACQAEFGPNSRMATSEEIIESTIQPTLPAPAAWVRQKIVPTGSIVDYSGVLGFNNSLNCNSWTQDIGGTYRGLVVLPNGGFRLDACAPLRPVACSISQ